MPAWQVRCQAGVEISVKMPRQSSIGGIANNSSVVDACGLSTAIPLMLAFSAFVNMCVSPLRFLEKDLAPQNGGGCS